MFPADTLWAASLLPPPEIIAPAGSKAATAAATATATTTSIVTPTVDVDAAVFPFHWQEVAMDTLTWVNALQSIKQQQVSTVNTGKCVYQCVTVCIYV